MVRSIEKDPTDHSPLLVKVRIKDTDKGFKEFMKKTQELKKKPYVKIGILESAGKHKDSDFTVAEVGMVHEFGGKDIPQRSFIRSTHDEIKDMVFEKMKHVKIDVLLRRTTVFKALSLVGLMVQRAIQKKITDGDSTWEPLKPETIKKKGSSKPLIDTGQLRASIRYEVKEGDK